MSLLYAQAWTAMPLDTLATWKSAWRLWQARRKARRELRELDARSLRDVGLSPQWVEYEASRPFWCPLSNWRS